MEQVNTWGIRLNFTNGSKMSFSFDADAAPHLVAAEINNFMQMKVDFLGIRDSKGKSMFERTSDVLPKRKMTIDILYKGELVKSAIMGVAVKPSAIFNNEGEFFSKTLSILCEHGQRLGRQIEQRKVNQLWKGLLSTN